MPANEEAAPTTGSRDAHPDPVTNGASASPATEPSDTASPDNDSTDTKLTDTKSTDTKSTDTKSTDTDVAAEPAGTIEPESSEAVPSPAPAPAPAPAPPKTARPRRRVWHSSRGMIITGIVFMVIMVAIPGVAVYAMTSGYTSFGDNQIVVLSVLGGLAFLALVYGWRFLLHPRIKLVDDVVRVINPIRTYPLHLEDITVFRPGPNGLIITTRDDEVDAWAVQKTASALKHDRRTRADEVSDELWAIWEDYHRPETVADGPVKLRYAHPEEADLLTELERSASLARLGHIFPADEFPYPESEVRQRWQESLDDKVKLIMIAEIDGTSAGYVCFGDRTIYHLGVAADHQRKGVGTALLVAAEEELFADVSIADIGLWVLEENDVARELYRNHGWEETDEVRKAEFPPHPSELMMVRDNPHRARRGR